MAAPDKLPVHVFRTIWFKALVVAACGSARPYLPIR